MKQAPDFYPKKLRGIINSDMLQGSSNMHPLFSCFLLYLTWLVGCCCRLIPTRTITASLCGYGAVSQMNFSPSEPDNCHTGCDPSLAHQHIFVKWNE